MSMIRIYINNIDDLVYEQQKLMTRLSNNVTKINDIRTNLDGKNGSSGATIDQALYNVTSRLDTIGNNMENIERILNKAVTEYSEAEKKVENYMKSIEPEPKSKPGFKIEDFKKIWNDGENIIKKCKEVIGICGKTIKFPLEILKQQSYNQKNIANLYLKYAAISGKYVARYGGSYVDELDSKLNSSLDKYFKTNGWICKLDKMKKKIGVVNHIITALGEVTDKSNQGEDWIHIGFDAGLEVGYQIGKSAASKAIGGAIGGLVGGPAGAVVGAAAGIAIGSAIDKFMDADGDNDGLGLKDEIKENISDAASISAKAVGDAIVGDATVKDALSTIKDAGVGAAVDIGDEVMNIDTIVDGLDNIGGAIVDGLINIGVAIEVQ